MCVPSIFNSCIVIWLCDCGNQELDFLNEAKNSEKCLHNFLKLSPRIAAYVYAPKVYWNLSTSKLLTMEFIDGAQVNDVKTIKKLGIRPDEVARLVSSISSCHILAIYVETIMWLRNWLVHLQLHIFSFLRSRLEGDHSIRSPYIFAHTDLTVLNKLRGADIGNTTLGLRTPVPFCSLFLL